MPPTARLPTVEFRSLLLAPLRIRLRTLYAFARPQCAPAALHDAPAATWVGQRRSLHLYQTAKAKTALGMHKVLDFKRYDVKPPSESAHRVNLVKVVKNKDPVVLEKNLSLQELYDKHVSPGNFIYLVDDVSKKVEGKFEEIRELGMGDKYNNYAIGCAHLTHVSKKGAQINRKHLGGLKNVIMLLSNPVEYRKLALDRAYQFVEIGSPVEFRIRVLGSAMAVKNRARTVDPDAVPWMLDHFPHLRPDFILKSMPEGSVFLVHPVSDGRMLQFVVGIAAKQMSKLDLTTRLFRVQKAVEASLPNNPMAQRFQYRKVKQKGGKVWDKGVERDMTDEEKAHQQQVVADAASGVGGRLHLLKAQFKDSKDGRGGRRGACTWVGAERHGEQEVMECVVCAA